MSDASELYDAILKGNAKRAEEVTKTALAENVDPSELVQKYMIPAMDEVGKRFECNDYFVPELLIAARAMKASLALITPMLAKSGIEPAGRVVIGTVQGDLHDIGKNLVASMPRGRRVPGGRPGRERVAAEVRRGGAGKGRHHRRPRRPAHYDHDDDEGGNRSARPGWHPRQDPRDDQQRAITKQYADEIGADGYTDNAGGAVALARKLLSRN